MKTELLKSHIQLENDCVLLIPFDTFRSQELRNIIFKEEIWRFIGMFIRTELDFENYLKTTIEDRDKGICYPFLIIDKITGRVAGSTRYGSLNTASEKCEIGWTWYGTDFQGTGLNKSCKYELLKFGFESIGFRRIQFSADQENIRSQKAIEKLGATKEGIFRNNYISTDGQSRNDIYYSIIKEDWNGIKHERFAEF